VNHVGIDLHKKTIVLCVMDPHRKVTARRTFACDRVQAVREFVAALRPFRAVVEATASYHWLVELLEPLAEAVLLAHPKKLRVIAESAKKTDRLDAQVLAEFPALGLIPEAHRPAPRRREHRALVRHRQYLRGRVTAVRAEVRRVLADYNADRKDLFTAAGRAYLAAVRLNASDRFVVDQLRAEFAALRGRLKELAGRPRGLAAAAPTREAEARAVLRTIPGVGPVTVEVVVSERGDVRRFSSAEEACASAGLVPAVRQSGGKRRERELTKEGSPLLRGAPVEAAWRPVRHSRRWEVASQGIKRRRGAKKAVVAVARRLLGVMHAMLKANEPYRPTAGAPPGAAAAGA
jgi:transposase